MKTTFQLTPLAQEIVEMLKEALDDAVVMLVDDHENTLHLSKARS